MKIIRQLQEKEIHVLNMKQNKRTLEQNFMELVNKA